MFLPKRGSAYGSVQRDIFRKQTVLILILAASLTAAGIFLTVRSDAARRDATLRNAAEAAAEMQLIIRTSDSGEYDVCTYMDALYDSLDSVDVVSVIGADGKRLYHSNHDLIGTQYDGTLPDFSGDRLCYVTDDTGPSGTQRRAYAVIRTQEGEELGFVLAVALMSNIRAEITRQVMIFAVITFGVVLVEMLISLRISAGIRRQLMGYEPDVLTSMFRIRENILETLDEGIIATDATGGLQFCNAAAAAILSPAGIPIETLAKTLLSDTKQTRETGIPERSIPGADILMDRIPLFQNDTYTGSVGILHDRTEYTRMAEDLAGTRFLVDSMRANNHDFTNKLHVIMGLLEMELYDEACRYIENISIVQRESISRTMHAVDDPAIAALLIGKTARASEVNSRFVLENESCYRRGDIDLPNEPLITVIGNLIDNALDAMNDPHTPQDRQRMLRFGIWSKPGELLIRTEDNGIGIPEEDLGRIFENGFTTKGSGHGTGLYQVQKLIHGLGGSINCVSRAGTGTVFTVRFGHVQETEAEAHV